MRKLSSPKSLNPFPNLFQQVQPKKGFFITGTDTDVGKTFQSAKYVRDLHAVYWKPFQTGLKSDSGDSATVLKESGCPKTDILPCAYEFQEPICPFSAAEAENRTIDPKEITLPFYNQNRTLIIEGAGGLMVPLWQDLFIIDFIKATNLPVILVAKNKLGALNHIFSSLALLEAYNIPLHKLILWGEDKQGNKSVLKNFLPPEKLL
ncbi:dethiobiotin synthase [Acetobacteraceae bacterium]|nr:dethiobiotin synthase [Acetobacteraceae bacterium]